MNCNDNAKNLLESIHACDESIAWVGDRTIEQAYAECERGDWLLWIAGAIGVDQKLLVISACACARSVLHHAPTGDDRPRLAIETAETWANGAATVAQDRISADSAYYAADSAAYAADSRT